MRFFRSLLRPLSHPLVRGTLILTAASILTKILGFLFRIFLSSTVGEEGMGIYQLALPAVGICIATISVSIQTALSRLTAAHRERGTDQEKSLLFAALFFSTSISLFFAAIVYPAAETISIRILNEERCAPILRVLVFSLPLSCIHSCLCGYYFGCGTVKHPAFSQLAEQCARMGSIVLIWLFRSHTQTAVSLTDVAAGAVIGELASSVYLCALWFKERRSFQSDSSSFDDSAAVVSHLRQADSAAAPSQTQPSSSAVRAKRRMSTFPFAASAELFRDMLPLAASRLCMTLLQTAESILIPCSLRAFGMSAKDALSVFGVLTGMTLPFLLFPSSLTHSASLLLTPKIAADAASGSKESIRKASGISIRFSLWLGIGFLILFFIFGPTLGQLCFQSRLAGTMLRSLSFICPFLYLSVTCAGILNGLGRMNAVFLHSLCCAALRTVSILLLVPRYGIRGWMYGMLASQLLLCLLHLLAIRRSA